MKALTLDVMVDLEKVLPPGDWDLQMHLVCHLVDEVVLCGTVHARWMYWVERYMKVLKGYVRQLNHPEGSMAQGHLHFEALFYCRDVVRRYDTEAPISWMDPMVNEDAGRKLLRKGRQRKLNEVELFQAHNYTLRNHPRMQKLDWLSGYLDLYPPIDPSSRSRPRGAPKPAFIDFVTYVRRKVDDMVAKEGDEAVDDTIKALAFGPLPGALSYNAMWEGGQHFRVHKCDELRKTMDSGVVAMSVLAGDEVNLIPYPGVVDEILELDFIYFKQVVMKCTWYKVKMDGPLNRRTLIYDESKFFKVKRDPEAQSRRTDEPFVFPTDCDQCYYVPVHGERGWSLVVPVAPRSRRYVQNKNDDEEDEEEDETHEAD